MITNSRDSNSDSSWKRRIIALDVEETKQQVLFALPMTLTNLFYYAITLVSVMFVGHLGTLELAGATLGNSWATITGIALVTGSAGALETLCGQGFGAEKYRMLGIYLQSSCIISIFISIVISFVWFFTEPILVLFQQDRAIAKQAALYVSRNLLSSQSVFLSAIPMALHFLIVKAFVYWTPLGFIGAPLAVSVSLWISLILLATYVFCSKKFDQTWQGFSFESFSCLGTTVRLALPSAAMVCLEYWAFEILVMFAGMMPNAELSTSLIAMCVNTEAIAYVICCGLSAASSTRVSNELGAGNIDRAKNAIAVTIKLALLLALILDVALGFAHNIWARFFSNDPEITRAFAGLTPFLLISIAFDAMQTSLQGVTRGCGWQHLGAYANLATFYLIGTPIGALLGFKFKLYVKGLWIGLICGVVTLFLSLLAILLCSNWSKLKIYVEKTQESQL